MIPSVGVNNIVFGGLGFGGYATLMFFAYLFARKKSVAPFLSAEAPQNIAPFVLVASTVFGLSFVGENVSVFFSWFPFAYVVAFLIGMGFGSLRMLLYAVSLMGAISILSQPYLAIYSEFVYTTVNISQTLTLLTAICLGRLLRCLSFGDICDMRGGDNERTSRYSLFLSQTKAFPLIVLIVTLLISANVHIVIGEKLTVLLSPWLAIGVAFITGYLIPYKQVLRLAFVVGFSALAAQLGLISIGIIEFGPFSIRPAFSPVWVGVVILFTFVGRAVHNSTTALRTEANLLNIEHSVESSRTTNLNYKNYKKRPLTPKALER